MRGSHHGPLMPCSIARLLSIPPDLTRPHGNVSLPSPPPRDNNLTTADQPTRLQPRSAASGKTNRLATPQHPPSRKAGLLLTSALSDPERSTARWGEDAEGRRTCQGGRTGPDRPRARVPAEKPIPSAARVGPNDTPTPTPHPLVHRPTPRGMRRYQLLGRRASADRWPDRARRRATSCREARAQPTLVPDPRAATAPVLIRLN